MDKSCQQALALVKLRGLEHFQDPSEFAVLVRLSGHSFISFVARRSSVPDDLMVIRAFVGKHLDDQHPRWRLSDLLVRYANIRSEIRRDLLSSDECIEVAMELDVELQAPDLDMPPSWQYSTTLLDHRSDRALNLHFDSYPDGSVSQIRNFLRLIRILLNETLIEYYLASPTRHKYLALIAVAHDNIETLVNEIYACVPQYTDCDGAARHRLLYVRENSDHMRITCRIVAIGELAIPIRPNTDWPATHLSFHFMSREDLRLFQTFGPGSSNNYTT
jgi:hypothetical protein